MITVKGIKYKDVTKELSLFSKLIHLRTCRNGIMVGGKYDGDRWLRRFNSPTMQHMEDAENKYYRTSEIFVSAEKQFKYYVVYRPLLNSEQGPKECDARDSD